MKPLRFIFPLGVLLAVTLPVFVGLLLFHCLQKFFPPLIAAAVGFLVVGFSVYGLVRVAASLGQLWRPVRPRCRSGVCRARDFEQVECRANGDCVVMCRCGDRYVQSGNRFLLLADDGSVQPFMRHSTFGRWRQDAVRLSVLIALCCCMSILLGCGGSAHFEAAMEYLNETTVAETSDAEFVEAIDYFIHRPHKQKAFLLKEASSSDPQRAIAAQLILTSLARGADELRKQLTEPVTRDLLVEIDLDDLLEKCHAVPTNGLSPTWIEWRTVSIDVLGIVKADQSKTNAEATVNQPK